jgi:hypothetical protein
MRRASFIRPCLLAAAWLCLPATLPGCSDEGRKLDDFICLSLYGYQCPEGFECRERDHPRGVAVMDDWGYCYVSDDNVCDPESPDCPLGFLCEDGDGKPYCRPDSPCGTSLNTCPDGKFCYTGFILERASVYSEGYCYPLPESYETSCSDEIHCERPLECHEGLCRIRCNFVGPYECPEDYECEGSGVGHCVP